MSSRKDSGTPELADFTSTPAGIAAAGTEPWASGMSAAEVKWRSATSGMQIGFGGKSVDHWLGQRNDTKLIPALLEASGDDNDLVRLYSLNVCGSFMDSKIAPRLIDVGRSDSSASNRGLALRMLRHYQQLTQEILASVMGAIETDPSLEVRAEALSRLTLKQPNNDLIHHTLLKWARSGDIETMQTAIRHLQYHPPTVKRQQGIDELIQLLAQALRFS